VNGTKHVNEFEDRLNRLLNECVDAELGPRRPAAPLRRVRPECFGTLFQLVVIEREIK